MTGNLLPTSTGGRTFCNVVWSHAIKSTVNQKQIPTEKKNIWKKSVDKVLSTRDLGTRLNPGCPVGRYWRYTLWHLHKDSWKVLEEELGYPDRLHTMADGNPVIVAVDGSEHSKKAFECKLCMITRLSFIIKTFVFQNALRKSGSLIINVADICWSRKRASWHEAHFLLNLLLLFRKMFMAPISLKYLGEKVEFLDKMSFFLFNLLAWQIRLYQFKRFIQVTLFLFLKLPKKGI